MIAAPNAISHGLTTAAAAGTADAGWGFAGISAAKPEPAAQARASVVVPHASVFIAFRCHDVIRAVLDASVLDAITVDIRVTAALAAKTGVPLIFSLL
jgi:hypothetical protein